MISCRYCHATDLHWAVPPSGGPHRLYTAAGERHHCPEQGAHIVALLKRVSEATQCCDDPAAFSMRYCIEAALKEAQGYFNTGEG
jgi:hypothetical protein